MPTILDGQRATSGSVSILQASRVVAMDQDIFLLDGDKAPLALLASKVGKKGTSNPEFKWMEDERIPTLDRINAAAGYTAGETTIVVDNGEYFRANGLLKVQRTGEVILIDSVAGNTLTVNASGRGWGASSAAAIVDNDQVVSLGSAFPEGSDAAASKTTQKVAQTNYTEIVKSDLEFTNTELASELYGPEDLAYQQRKVAVEHAVDIENKFWFGSKAEAASGNGIRRSTGGLDEIISTNDSNFGGVFNMVTFFGFAESVFRYGSNKKLMFASRSVVSNISLEAIKYLEIVNKEEAFGLNIRRLITPHGDLMVMTHDLFEGDTYGKRAYVVDLDGLGYRFLRGRDTKLHTNIQSPGADSRKDEYRSEVGLVRKVEKIHGRITNAA